VRVIVGAKKLKPNFIASRPGDSEFSCSSNEKIRESLGYEPKVSLQQGLADLIRYEGGG